MYLSWLKFTSWLQDFVVDRLGDSAVKVETNQVHVHCDSIDIHALLKILKINTQKKIFFFHLKAEDSDNYVTC